MKKIFALLIVVVLTTVACSSKPPSVRVVNQRTSKANVQVKLENTNTININDVASGATTSYQDITEGAVLATAVIQNESVSPTLAFNTSRYKNYSIVITSATPPSIRIDSEDK